ncbi:MAG TPA: MFS transporter [Steroidobacteraceae bacterium]|nr:MFS transporter [Steroidobacteraceae bacterium]
MTDGAGVRMPGGTAESSQFRLLRERRFLPLFVTQALGAFNDNLLKNLLLLAATYHTASYTHFDPRLLVNLAGGLFILPFVLLSGLAGQLADRFDKSAVMKIVKAAELGIMALAAWGFFAHSLVLLLASLFLMGVHSTFFAPAKYGLLPQVLRPAELVGGNALVETGTFVAILLGTTGAGLLAERSGVGAMAVALCTVALAGFLASLLIPRVPPAAPTLRIDWNPWVSTWANIRAARESRAVFLSLLGLSWFWFYGALVLAQLPVYCHFVVNGTEQVVTLMLVVFAAAVGVGSLLCERLSGKKVEIGLVPFGSIGLTLFALDLAWASPAVPAAHALTAREFLTVPHAWRILIDLAGIGLFGGLYAVPLYAVVQQRARPEALSRVIAANSILNALFMVAAAAFGAAMLAAGLSVPQLVLLTALLNAAVAAYIYTLVPEFLLRFVAWLLVHTVYRLDERGLENIPDEGAALLVCNHVSFVDALVISAACRRPIRFVMESAIFSAPVINVLARGMKAVPIASQKEDPAVYEHAFATVAHELAAGELVCIFPEGRLTTDGLIGPFRPGLMRILAQTPVPVVPIALSGLWGSLFSRHARRFWAPLLQSISARIGISVGPAVPPAEVTPELLRERVLALCAHG